MSQSRRINKNQSHISHGQASATSNGKENFNLMVIGNNDRKEEDEVDWYKNLQILWSKPALWRELILFR